MRKNPIPFLLITFSTTLISLQCSQTRADSTIGFEDIALDASSSNEATGSNPGSFFSQGVEFNRSWVNEFDCCPGGWAASNRTDQTTAGFTNPYSAFIDPTGGGAEGSGNFAVATSFARGESVVTLHGDFVIQELSLANTTYAFLAIRDGNDGGGNFVRQFDAGDWFRLEIFGIDSTGGETGRVEFHLADFRDGNSLIVDDWTSVDLTSLGTVRSLEFELSSTDNGDFGMNTPAYFAVDNIVVGVPEPGTASLLFLNGATALFLRRRC